MKQDRSEYMKEYRLKNRRKLNLHMKKYYRENPEYYKKYHKEYYEKNSEKIKDYQKTYREENREKIRTRERKRQKDNPHLSRANNAKRRATKLSATPNWLSNEQNKYMTDLYLFRQNISGVVGREYHVDHIVPLQGENVCGLHVPWNLQVIPAKDNLSKRNFT